MDIESALNCDEEQVKETPQDNFFSPRNQSFYEQRPYSDLNPSKQEIRLLELDPLENDKPINARLRTISLQSSDTPPPRYCAISYCAGKHTNTEVMFVNGIAFNAFANPELALRQAGRIRERSDLRWCPNLIWTDQICINQSNVTERSQQVGFMRNIYENADVVLACLGEDSTNGRWQGAAHRLAVESVSSTITLTDMELRFRDHVIGDFIDDDFRSDWLALEQLLESPWWQRCWIHQEALVAQRIVVCYGLDSLDWKILAPVIELMHYVAQLFLEQLSIRDRDFREDGKDRLIHSGFDTIFAASMVHSREVWQQKRERDILELLSHARECQVTDPRDRVYAYLGLIDPGYGIVANYEEHVSTTLTRACKKIITFERRLHVLACCADVNEQGPRRTDVPSWVPDWSLPGKTIYGYIYDPVYDDPPFRASADYRSAAEFCPANETAPRSLRVQCLFIDQLATESQFISSYATGDQIDVVDIWWSLAGFDDQSKDSLYFCSKSWSIWKAFWNTVLRGKPNHANYTAEDFAVRMSDVLSRTGQYGRFFRSPKGYLGVTKNVSQLHYTDSICVLLGANTPYILRKVDDHFLLVTDAYVEGLMDGESIDMMRWGELTVQTIDIH